MKTDYEENTKSGQNLDTQNKGVQNPNNQREELFDFEKMPIDFGKFEIPNSSNTLEQEELQKFLYEDDTFRMEQASIPVEKPNKQNEDEYGKEREKNNRNVRGRRTRRKKNIFFRIFISSLLILSTIIINIFVTLKVIAFVDANKIDELNYRVENMLSLGETGLTMEMQLINSKYPPIIENGEFYLSLDTIKNGIDEYIFWDEKEQKITITNEHNVIRMNTESLEYYVNDDILKLDLPVYNIDGIAYMPLSLVEDFYNLDVYYSEDNDMLTIFNNNHKSATISKNTDVFFNEDMTYSVEKIEKGSNIYFKEMGEELTHIVTDNGILGYVKSNYIKDEKILENDEFNQPNYEVAPLTLGNNGKINLVFDQMQNVVASTYESRRTPHTGMDVLVPTWFSFKDESGEIVNIADKGYVNWAHSEGYQVWGLLTDNFNSSVSHAVLSSSETREYVIKQILAYVSIYELDGINIDFESVPQADGENFIQFLRELAPALREQNVILSVDTFVPKPWTSHYNREELGKIVDYVIVMGYDEHYSGSPTAGSVASLEWSDIAIKDTLLENVPKEKLILGIPFYVRVWTETTTNGVTKLSSQALGMNGAYNFIIERGGSFEYDPATQQLYGEVKEDNKTYKVWLEDESSLEKRLNLVLDYDIAGVGAWKRGLEKDTVWELMEQILKQPL